MEHALYRARGFLWAMLVLSAIQWIGCRSTRDDALIQEQGTSELNRDPRLRDEDLNQWERARRDQEDRWWQDAYER